jgi:chaperonin cofactor prefoldin
MSTSPGDLEPRVSRLEVAFKDLEDAMIVMSHLEKRMSEAFKDQAAYIAEHEKRVRELEDRNRKLEERERTQRQSNLDIDARIDKLVSAIGAMISQRPQ